MGKRGWFVGGVAVLMAGAAAVGVSVGMAQQRALEAARADTERVLRESAAARERVERALMGGETEKAHGAATELEAKQANLRRRLVAAVRPKLQAQRVPPLDEQCVKLGRPPYAWSVKGGASEDAAVVADDAGCTGMMGPHAQNSTGIFCCPLAERF